MSRIAYVSGRYLPHRRAAVHIEDRGYQFSDGVYEVIAIQGGRLMDLGPHLDRLERSLAALSIPAPMPRRPLLQVMEEVRRRNQVRNGILYLQITRGVAPREHGFPASAAPVLVITARRHPGVAPALAEKGVAVITIPDLRWRRCDIKSVSLLANILGKQQAREAGAFEAWQVDEAGRITEGTSTNAWIVTAGGEIRTRHLDAAILAGVTRAALKEVIAVDGLALTEEGFTVEEAKHAAEAFLTSTTSRILPVVTIDGAAIGTGTPGPVTRRLMATYDRARMEQDS